MSRSNKMRRRKRVPHVGITKHGDCLGTTVAWQLHAPCEISFICCTCSREIKRIKKALPTTPRHTLVSCREPDTCNYGRIFCGDLSVTREYSPKEKTECNVFEEMI